MKMPKTKNKGLLVIALVAVLAAATTVNYKLSEKSNTASSDSQGMINAELVSTYSEEDVMTSTTGIDSKFFAQYRTQREKTRSENISLLENIVSDSESTTEMVTNAQQEIIKLTQLSEKEMVVENLIKAKGFSDVIAFIHEGYVNVIIEAEQLSAAQAAQVQDIVVKECGVEVSKVCIALSKAK
jgi:stage III sporulation protein AH